MSAQSDIVMVAGHSPRAGHGGLLIVMVIIVGLVLVFNEKIAKFSRLRKDDIKEEGNNSLRVNSSTDCYRDFKKQNRGRERVR